MYQWTLKPNIHQIQQIKTISQTNPIEESCGYIKGDCVYLAVNEASDRAHHFEFSIPEGATCIWHSHVNGNDDFSVEDIKKSKALGIPYFLYCVGSGVTQYFDPNTIAPYLEREFHWAWQNCYTLMQDYYKQELNVELPDFYLSSPQSYEYEEVGYLDQLPRHGFRRLEDDEPLQRCDVVLSYCGTRFPNHIAIVVDPSQNIIVHHLVGQLSKFDVCPDRRRRGIHSAWRSGIC